MKKPNLSLLTVFSCIFAAFVLGFFLGRNLFRADIVVSVPLYTPPETSAAAEATTAVSVAEWPVNINTADIHDLTSLPGIGETLARRIIDYRTANGPFSAPEELLHVSGIGNTKLEAILDLITTGG